MGVPGTMLSMGVGVGVKGDARVCAGEEGWLSNL